MLWVENVAIVVVIAPVNVLVVRKCVVLLVTKNRAVKAAVQSSVIYYVYIITIE